MCGSWTAIWKYAKISVQKTLFNLKLKVQIVKKGKHEKKTRRISSMLKKLSATAIKYLSVTRMLYKTRLESTLPNNKTCTPRYSYREYPQLIIYWIQPIFFKNKCINWVAEANLGAGQKPILEFSCKNN